MVLSQNVLYSWTMVRLAQLYNSNTLIMDATDPMSCKELLYNYDRQYERYHWKWSDQLPKHYSQVRFSLQCKAL